MAKIVPEVAFAVGIGLVVTAAFVGWSDPAGRVLGVPSEYAAAFGVGIGLAILLQAGRALADER